MAEIDIFNIQPNKVNRTLSGKYLLVYGQSKIGKTTFCTTCLPKPLLCAFEKGYTAIPGIRAIDIKKWVDFKKVIKLLESDQAHEMYETIVIDTADIMASLCEEYICQQNGVKDFNEVGFGALYKSYSKELSTTLRKITMMGYGCAFICQEDIKMTKNSHGEDVEKIQPLLDKRALKVINALVDFILYIAMEWDENSKGKRFFYTRNTPFIVAGSRFGEMEPKIDFNYESLIEAIGKAMENSVRNNKALLVEEDYREEKTSKRLFSEAMQEAGEIWAKFPKEASWNEKKANIVKEYFGQPIRLSTVNENQQDLLESVIEELKELLSTVGE